jgi:hypothetical protein
MAKRKNPEMTRKVSAAMWFPLNIVEINRKPAKPARSAPTKSLRRWVRSANRPMTSNPINAVT